MVDGPLTNEPIEFGRHVARTMIIAIKRKAGHLRRGIFAAAMLLLAAGFVHGQGRIPEAAAILAEADPRRPVT